MNSGTGTTGSQGPIRVLNSLVEPRLGGPQKRSLAVARSLRSMGVETVFLIPTGTEEFADEASAAGFDIRRVSFPRLRRPRLFRQNISFLTRFRQTVSAIEGIIDEEGVDVVHASMSTNVQTARATTRSDAALVWHLNATVLPRPLNRVIGYLARRWSDELVVSSRSVAEYYFGTSADATIIYPPVDLETFDPNRVAFNRASVRSELSLPRAVPVVGAVGNLNPIKGQDRLIEATEVVVDEWGEIVVPLVGAELDSQRDYATRLRRLVDRDGLANLVKFVGWRDDVPELLSLFDLFVCPSLTESGPMVVLEAMAMGCPVVTTNVGMIPEHFEDGEHCWIVEPGDSAELAAAIVDALRSPEERERRAERARSVVLDHLSLSDATARHKEVYADALASSRPARDD